MIESIIKLIQDRRNIVIDIEENFEFLSVIVSSDLVINLKSDFLSIIKSNLLTNRDEIIDFSISINENPINLDLNDFRDFWEDYQSIVELYEDNENCSCELKIRIKKYLKNNILSIYSLTNFFEYLNSISCLSLLRKLSQNKYIYFEIIDQSIQINCYSNMFYFYTKGTSIEQCFEESHTRELIDIQFQNCSFINRQDIGFEPNNFKISGSYNNDINNIFKKLVIVYSLIFIFDDSEINENNIEVSLCGKTVEVFTLHFKNSNFSILDKYYDIFKWLYDTDNVIDKLLIARNVLSVNLYRKAIPYLPNNILSTIKSNYKIYKQDNFEKYVSSKTSAITNLLDIQKQICELSNNLTDNFFRNITIICTFIFTIIILNPISNGQLNDIFTKDITIISLALDVLSVVYLQYTIYDVNTKRDSLILLQDNINSIYNDILSEETLKEIVTDNEYYKKSLKQLNEKINRYKWLWYITIALFFLLIIVLGWVQFSNTFEYIKNIFSQMQILKVVNNNA